MAGAADYIRFGGRELHSALRKEFKEERQMNSASTFWLRHREMLSKQLDLLNSTIWPKKP